MRHSGRLGVSVAAFVLAMEVALTAQSPVRDSQAGPLDTGLFRTIARQQTPSVVAITTRRAEILSEEDAAAFERLFGRALPKAPQIRREIASGIIISRDGDILTNDHVVAGVDRIEVRILGHETTTYRATVVGRDPLSDSAVIRLVDGPRDLPCATLGDSDVIEPGDWVMAIGNPFQLGHSVTVGVVSYHGRSFPIAEDRWLKLIQTDASINPGSSGGPLLNARGEVIGINVATLADALGDTMGIGFAVPINGVKQVLPQLRAGHVVRGHLGVQVRRTLITDSDATVLGLPAAAGALVTSVDSPSLAEAAGIRAGDVVVDLARSRIADADELIARVSAMSPGVRVPVTIIRDGHERIIVVQLDARPIEDNVRIEPPAASVDVGWTLRDLPPGTTGGAVVQSVREDGLAAMAGIEKGDIVRKINRRTIHTSDDVRQALQRLPAGASSAFVLVSRAGRELLVEIQQE
jgi:S1-C subfamily serine protease